MKKILLVDGHSIANRAFYGLPVMTTSSGVCTQAIYGFISILSRALEMTEADGLAVAFDHPSPTFRHQMFQEYKGTRKAMPEELRSQIPLIQEFLTRAQVPVIVHAGLEADDILGTLARTAETENEVFILSGDRDLLQLVNEHTRVVMPTAKRGVSETLLMDEAAVREKTGVSPAEYLQAKALMGDSSDNIPGVPSIGEKTAAAIISQYHTVEEAIAHADEIKPKAAGRKLAEFADQARLSLDLASIRTQADFPERPADFSIEQFGKKEVLDFYKQYELKSLVARYAGLVKEEEKKDGSVYPVSIVTDRDMLRQLAAQLDGGFTYRLFQQEDTLFGFWALAVIPQTQIAEQNGQTVYWIEEGDLSREEIMEIIGEAFADPSIPKIGHDVKPDRIAFHALGRELSGLKLDTVIGAYLLNPLKEAYEENELSTIFLSGNIRSRDEVFGSGKNRKLWSDLSLQERASFGAELTMAVHRSAPVLMEKIEAQGMLPLLQEIELPLIEVLASMETYGVRVDVRELQRFGETLQGDIVILEKKIYEEAGEEFNILSPKQLGEILFDKLMLPAGKKTKSGYSTAADILEKLAPEYEIVRDILQYRQLTKLKSTYVEGMKPFIREDGKIHAHFNQTVTATGRLSSSDPNLQNIPIRTELGRALRKAFVPSDSSFLFMDADYSQIELRLLAAMSGDEAMVGAYRDGLDIHRLTASQVLGIPMDQVNAAQRSSAKAVSFGIIYGISAFSLSDDLHISQKAAKNYIDRYYEQFPKVRGYLESCIEQAAEKGYAVTLFGRRRPMDELRSSNFIQRSFGERVARNMPIQGTAADIMKIAMIRVYQRLKAEQRESRLLITVHDELLIEVKRGEEEAVQKILEEEMMSAASLAVPLEIGIASGENWFEAK